MCKRSNLPPVSRSSPASSKLQLRTLIHPQTSRRQKIGNNARPRRPSKKNHKLSAATAPAGAWRFPMKKGAKLNTAFKGFGPLSPNSKQKQHGRALVASRTKQVPHYAKRGAPPVIGRGGRPSEAPRLRGRSRSPWRRAALGVAGSASAHLGPHRSYQASTGGADSPAGAAVKQPAASSERASYPSTSTRAGFAQQQQQQLSTRAGIQRQHLISTRAGFNQPSTGLPACFYCVGGGSFFPLLPENKSRFQRTGSAGPKKN
jgi:hypothetical protein